MKQQQQALAEQRLESMQPGDILLTVNPVMQKLKRLVRPPESEKYWVAWNGDSISLCPYTSRTIPRTSPVPESMIGFPSEEAAKRFCREFHSTSTRAEAIQAMERWVKDPSITIAVYETPEPPGEATEWIPGHSVIIS